MKCKETFCGVSGTMHTEARRDHHFVVERNLLAEHHQAEIKCKEKLEAVRSAWEKVQYEKRKHKLHTITVRSGEIIGFLEYSHCYMCPRDYHQCFHEQVPIGKQDDGLLKKWASSLIHHQVDPSDPDKLLVKEHRGHKFFPPVCILVPEKAGDNTAKKRAEWGTSLAQAMSSPLPPGASEHDYTSYPVTRVYYAGDLSVSDKDDRRYLSEYLTNHGTFDVFLKRHPDMDNIIGYQQMIDKPDAWKQCFHPNVLEQAKEFLLMFKCDELTSPFPPRTW